MRFTIQVLAALLAFGCAKKEAPAPSASVSVPAVSAHADTASQPAQAAAPALVAPGSLSGKVLETMDSGGYTYLKLHVADGEKWAAVRAAKVKVGQQVTVVEAMEMHAFQSKTLNRTFDSIWFGSLAPESNAPAAPAAAPAKEVDLRAMAAQHAVAAQGPNDVGDVKVPKAQGANAYTVAEVFAKKAELKDKPVTIRGKVVKSLSGIMGKNWLHVRDGSGSQAKKDDDLTITTNGTAAVGDVVVVSGLVHLDRDFGAGYSYPVIVEEATIGR